MKKNLRCFLMMFCLAAMIVTTVAQEVANSKNPKIDLSLSPAKNERINPFKNPGINPKTNWNINPAYNKLINPAENANINPMKQDLLNPMKNQLLNPMRFKGLHPKSDTWSGYYMFDGDDNIVAFMTKPSKEVLICFDVQGNWTCYYVLTPEGTYNHFEMNGEWSGNYLCPDNVGGFNVFDKEGTWTGKHIK